jgi:hypothetical protein
MPNKIISENPWIKFITTQKEWNLFYDESVIDSPTLINPQIDFENYQVIAGGLGMRTSGGYMILVKDVLEFEHEIYVNIIDIRPGNNCIVTSEITYPSTIIVIKKTSKPIKFFVSKYTSKC